MLSFCWCKSQLLTEKRSRHYWPVYFMHGWTLVVSVSCSFHTIMNSFKQVLSSSWDGRPLGHNRHGPKTGCVALLGGGAGTLCRPNTMRPGPRPTFIPSGILIHPAIWPQQMNRHGPKFGGCALCSGAWSGSNTMLPGPRPTIVPSDISFIKMHKGRLTTYNASRANKINIV